MGSGSIQAVVLVIVVLFSIASFSVDYIAYGQQDVSPDKGESNAYKKQIEEAKKNAEKMKEKASEARQKIKDRIEKVEEDRKRQEEIINEIRQKVDELRSDIREKDVEKAKKIAQQQQEVRKKIMEQLSKDDTIRLEGAEKIQERLVTKLEMLNEKTTSILEKIEQGRYLGPKFGDSTVIGAGKGHSYLLSFIDVDAVPIAKINNTNKIFDTFYGNVTLETYDKKGDSVKFEITHCDIVVGEIPYGCGFGKARVVSLQENMQQNRTSIVLIAFLEDAVENQIHSTLKLFLQSDYSLETINAGKESSVSVLGPQSVVSHQYFLNGTAKLQTINGSGSVTLEAEESFAEKDAGIEQGRSDVN